MKQCTGCLRCKHNQEIKMIENAWCKGEADNIQSIQQESYTISGMEPIGHLPYMPFKGPTTNINIL